MDYIINNKSMAQGYTLQQLQQMGAKPVQNSQPQGQGFTLNQLKANQAKANMPKVPTFGQALVPALEKTGSVIVKDATNVISGIGQTILHPVKTVETLNNIVSGAAQGDMGSMTDAQWKQYQKTNGFSDDEITKLKSQAQVNKQAFDSAVKMVKERYGSWDAFKNTVTTDPIGFMLDLSVLLSGGGSTLSKLGEVSDIEKLSEAGEVVSEVGETINPISQTTKLGAKGLGMLKGTPLTEEKILGRITQATEPYDIKQAGTAFKGVDTTNIKTYEDASTAMEKGIKNDVAAQDKILEKYPETFKPDDLTKSVTPESGGRAIKVNYPQEELDGLKQLYKNIKDVDGQVEIKDLQNKYNKTGLTSKELNDLARRYNKDLGSKGFSVKTGDPLTSVSAQEFENIRKGGKEAAVGTLPDDASRQLDKQISAKYDTQDLMDKQVKAVKKIQNKIEQVGLLKKAGNILGKGIDIASGKSVGGFLRGLMEFKPAKNLSALELQSELQKNLSLLGSLDKMTPQEAYNQIIALSAAQAYYSGKITNAANTYNP